MCVCVCWNVLVVLVCLYCDSYEKNIKAFCHCLMIGFSQHHYLLTTYVTYSLFCGWMAADVDTPLYPTRPASNSSQRAQKRREKKKKTIQSYSQMCGSSGFSFYVYVWLPHTLLSILSNVLLVIGQIVTC